MRSAEDLREEDRIRGWLKQWVGKQEERGAGGKEFPTNAFIRWIGWDQRDFNAWINAYEHKSLPPRQKRAMLRFIGLWMAGRIDFVKAERSGRGRKPFKIVILQEPKRMPMRLKVDVSTRSLSFVPKTARPLDDPMLRPRGNVLDRLKTKG